MNRKLFLLTIVVCLVCTADWILRKSTNGVYAGTDKRILCVYL